MKESLRAAVLVCATILMGSALAQSRSTDAQTGNQSSQMPSQSTHPADSKLGPSLNRASKLIGTDVVDAQGKKIGDIKDIVLDRTRGQVAYAVVSFGGVMGVGRKYFAIPWKSLQATADDKYALNVDKDTLKRAPGFDKDRWPDMASEQWNSQVYQFYNQTPYWKESSASAKSQQSSGSTGNTGSSGSSTSK